MATAIDTLLKVPQGIPTQVLTTSASESASLAIVAFGQPGGTKMDAKIVASSVTVPTNVTVASNFSKTAHPGGVLDLVSTYAYSEETLGGTAYRHLIYPGSGSSYSYRNRNVNELFDTPTTITPAVAHVRDGDVSRSLALSKYITLGGNTDLLTGTATRMTPLASLSSVGTKSGLTYYGCGAYTTVS